MKGALSSKPSYQFDENGNLVANEGESEEALATRESIVLYKEGFSANHPADVAAFNGAADGEEAPVNEEPAENETDQQRQDREARDQVKREAWERNRKIVTDQEGEDRKREATRGSYQSGARSEQSAANDSNDPSYSRPTSDEEVEEAEMEEAEEENDSPETTADKAKRRHRRGR
jgi:hypothetical protein